MKGKVRREPRSIFIENFWVRFYKLLDWICLCVYAIAVALIAFLADYFLAWFIGLIIQPILSKYTTVSMFFDWFQIGSASLTLVVAFVIAFFSAVSQMRFAYETATEPSFGGVIDE